MKTSLSWLMLSSALATSLSFNTLLAADETLSPSDSVDGTSSTEFTGKTSATATTYSLSGNVFFINLGETPTLTSSCFSNTTESLSFLGNHYSLLFSDIKSTTIEGVAISVTADKFLILSGFSKLSFLRTPPPTTTETTQTGKGAIKCGGSTDLENNTELLFSYNFSENDGGAITTKKLSITGNTATTFSHNAATTGKKGGAIYASGSVDISSNYGTTSFTNNRAGTSGGAIHTDANCSITGNKSVLFNSNQATDTAGSGGAISCSSTTAGTTPVLTLTGNSELVFTNNLANANGGAIYTNKLVLASAPGRGVSFLKNVVSGATPKGGAIAIADGGEISLSAEGSNIIFDGNIVDTTTTTGTNPHSLRRNSINLGSGAKILTLRASTGNGIFFFDPITKTPAAASPIASADTTTPASPVDTNTAGATTPGSATITAATTVTPGTTTTTATTDPLNINEADPTTGKIFNGTIVFSGEKLSAEERAIPENLKTTFTQPVTLKNGTLALQSGVTLDVGKFTQEAPSLLLMDVGTKLTSADDVTVNNLAINLDSISGTQQATLESTGTGKTVTLSGPIILTDKDGKAYENHDLSASQVFNLVSLVTPTAIPVADLPIVVPDTTDQTHYGDQGFWSVAWKSATTPGATTTTTTTAEVIWTKTGYIPNPERRASLVPNTLWGTFMDMRALHQLMSACTTGIQHSKGFWVSSIANFFHRDMSETNKRYRHMAAGFTLAGSTLTPKDDAFTLAFCQLYLRDKDYDVTKNEAQTYAGSLFFKHTHTARPRDFFVLGRSKLPPAFTSKLPEELPLEMDVQVTFGHTNNTMKTRYTTLPESEGTWSNEFISGEISASLPRTLTNPLPLLQRFSPLIKVHMAYAHQSNFSETTVEGRYFESSRLLNLSIPVGIKLEKDYKNSKGTYDVSVFYVPDVYRHSPHCLTTLMITGDTWETYATNPSRQALLVRGANNYILDPRWELFGHCAAEIRNSSRDYSVDLGSKFRF